MKVPINWTPDCQGKWDYDGGLVEVSTRYWPREGGFHVLTPDREWQGNAARPGIRPSATSDIVLGNNCDDNYDERVVLIRQEFEGDTEAEVKAAVEVWVAEQFARIGKALLAAFAIPVPPAGEGVA